MYYAKLPPKKTPEPFAEFRVFMITDKPIKFPEKLFDLMLDRLEWSFASFRKAREQNAIFFIEGKEINRKLDREEALENLLRTGIEARLGEPYRQVHIMKRTKDFVYNEASIRAYGEPDVIFHKEFGEITFKEWRRIMKERGVFEDDVK